MSETQFDKDFDKDFDGGADISGVLNEGKAARPALEIKRVNVDFPMWMVHALDMEARKRGVTRQSVIKGWLEEKLARQVNPASHKKK